MSSDNSDDVVIRLRRRAEIRRNIPRSEPDRISEILQEAALEIEKLRNRLTRYEEYFIIE